MEPPTGFRVRVAVGTVLLLLGLMAVAFPMMGWFQDPRDPDECAQGFDAEAGRCVGAPSEAAWMVVMACGALAFLGGLGLVVSGAGRTVDRKAFARDQLGITLVAIGAMFVGTLGLAHAGDFAATCDPGPRRGPCSMAKGMARMDAAGQALFGMAGAVILVAGVLVMRSWGRGRRSTRVTVTDPGGTVRPGASQVPRRAYAVKWRTQDDASARRLREVRRAVPPPRRR